MSKTQRKSYRGTVGATERRRREHLGGSGGMLTQKNFEIYRALEMRFPAF